MTFNINVIAYSGKDSKQSMLNLSYQYFFYNIYNSSCTITA